MSILDFIPSEYWAQLKTELNSLDASELARLASDRGTTPAPRRETQAERSARIAAEYDAAIQRRKKQDNAARRLTPEYKAAQERAKARRQERRETERVAEPPKPPGRPRAPTDGLTPEQIKKRERDRQRLAEYREQCRRNMQLIKERQQRAQEAPQSHADTSAAQSPNDNN